MPQQTAQPKQQKKVSTGPSQGLVAKLLGASPMTPEMEEGIKIARAENPKMGAVESYGPLSRMFMGDANAYVSPAQTIYLNPNTLQGQNSQEIADVLTHEQTHVGQMQDRGYGPTREFFHQMFGGNEAYGRRPDEIEAYAAEEARRTRMRRMPGVRPSFSSGEMIMPADIHLPQERHGVSVGPSSAALKKLQGKK